MKKVLLMIMMIICCIGSNAQTYIKAGVNVPINPLGIGIDLDFGYKLNIHQLSIGVVHDLYNDNVLFNAKYGVFIYDRYTIHAGIGYKNPSTDNKKEGYWTYIVGFEYNTKSALDGRFYYGIDLSQKFISLKMGMKFKY